jgi:hypothetical protein
MEESLSGGTTNLLRMARSGCQSAVAFVALTLGEQTFATAMYPTAVESDSLSADAVDDLVRQLWLDPSLGHGKALVRTVRLAGRWPTMATKRLAIAAVPLGTDDDGRPWGVLGVADPETKSFGLPELELLSRIAQRLSSYVRARHEVRHQLSARGPEDRGPEASGGVSSEATNDAGVSLLDDAPRAEPWWTVEPGPSTAAAPGRLVTASPATPTMPAPPVRFLAAPSAPSAPAPPAPVPPPFPPPAGTVGVRLRAADPAPPPADPAPRGADESAPVPSHAPPVRDPVVDLLGREGLASGLVPLGALLGRTGRLLGAGAETSGSLVVVALDLAGVPDPVDETVVRAVQAMRAELRFDDPVARVGRAGFVAVVPVVGGAAGGDVITARLVDAVRAALVDSRDASVQPTRVQAVHIEADLAAGHDADELVRSAVGKLRAD